MQPEWDLPLSPDGIVMELRNGGRMRVRPIRSNDASGLIAAYEELSHESRYYRFFTARPRLTQALADRLADIDHESHFAWVVFDADAVDEQHQQGYGVGAARLIRDADTSSAEAALTVLDDYQHRGIGRFLIELLVSTAAELNIDTLRFEVLRENQKMRKLMTGTGASAHTVSGEPGVVEFRLTVPPADSLAVAAGSIYQLLRHVAAEEPNDDDPAAAWVRNADE